MEPQGSVYEPCQEAADAKEERVQERCSPAAWNSRPAPTATRRRRCSTRTSGTTRQRKVPPGSGRNHGTEAPAQAGFLEVGARQPSRKAGGTIHHQAWLLLGLSRSSKDRTPTPSTLKASGPAAAGGTPTTTAGPTDQTVYRESQRYVHKQLSTKVGSGHPLGENPGGSTPAHPDDVNLHHQPASSVDAPGGPIGQNYHHS